MNTTTQTRINTVCAFILSGRKATRRFDSCLENDDNKMVAAGIYRRALKNPKIMEKMPQYLVVALVKADYDDLGVTA